MDKNNSYQVSIIGGGLAGLTLAIQMAEAGICCILFEKNIYPFHKVCGEYISMESKNFLEGLGFAFSSRDLPVINRLQVSSPSGNLMKHNLDLGGFGVSRFLLDNELVEIAKRKGVKVLEDCKVNDVRFTGEKFIIDTPHGSFTSEICVGSWGKKSNLDTKLKRPFTKNNKKKKNYVGIKYHVTLDFPPDLIELHNFENGYCGISKVENNRYCLCYLTDSDNLKRFNGDIRKMETEVLMKNPFLKHYFTQSAFLFTEPIAISQIKVGYKGTVDNHILMIGDSAGNIAPLSGNGMSMAMKSSFMLNELLISYFRKSITREQLENKYERIWRKQFKNRINLSKFFQKLLKNINMTNFAITVLKRSTFLRSKIVESTHGKPF